MTTDRIKVQPVYSAWGTIQGWAINRANRELRFFAGDDRVRALTYANFIAANLADFDALGLA